MIASDSTLWAAPDRPSQGQYDHDFGAWIRAPRCDPPIQPRGALFLDRDGVVVEDTSYLCRAEDMILTPGAAQLIGLANRAAIPVVEVTNQAGIGLGYYGWDDYLNVELALEEELARSGAIIDATFACPFHPRARPPYQHPEHPARKPQPGMLFNAARRLNLDLKNSWIVGDRLSDMQAGLNAGLRGGLHVLTGHGVRERSSVLKDKLESFSLLFGDSIRDARFLIDFMSRTQGGDEFLNH